jgi:hypothetical protein
VLRLAMTVAGVKVVHRLRTWRTKKETSYGVPRRISDKNEKQAPINARTH